MREVRPDVLARRWSNQASRHGFRLTFNVDKEAQSVRVRATPVTERAKAATEDASGLPQPFEIGVLYDDSPGPALVGCVEIALRTMAEFCP